jgi:hypothetical protein
MGSQTRSFSGCSTIRRSDIVAADNALARLADLASALEAVAIATARADSDALAACESPLACAVADLPTPDDLANCPSTDTTLHLRRIQLALRRCRRVGATLTEVVTASLSAQGVAPAYAPPGLPGHAPRLGRLQVRA